MKKQSWPRTQWDKPIQKDLTGKIFKRLQPEDKTLGKWDKFIEKTGEMDKGKSTPQRQFESQRSIRIFQPQKYIFLEKNGSKKPMNPSKNSSDGLQQLLNPQMSINLRNGNQINIKRRNQSEQKKPKKIDHLKQSEKEQQQFRFKLNLNNKENLLPGTLAPKGETLLIKETKSLNFCKDKKIQNMYESSLKPKHQIPKVTINLNEKKHLRSNSVAQILRYNSNNESLQYSPQKKGRPGQVRDAFESSFELN